MTKELESRYWEEKHHHQIYDLGGDGYYIEAHRIDRPDIQDLNTRVFAKGRPIREKRLIYNIKYDYYREISIKNGKMQYDYLYNRESYGHLLFEFQRKPEEGSLYRFAYEPVTDGGSEMFRKEGLHRLVNVPELHIRYSINLYNEETYGQWNIADGLITEVEEIDRRIDTKQWKFDPVKTRQYNLDFFKEQAEYLLIPQVPIDYRFVD